jgi:hypothetical protein
LAGRVATAEDLGALRVAHVRYHGVRSAR